jgi:hypothetical protein
MTPQQIAAMVADRDAGTPGPWKVFTLWNAYRSGQLITIAEAEAMVAAVKAQRDLLQSQLDAVVRATETAVAAEREKWSKA